jgi:hypothetical protein
MVANMQLAMERISFWAKSAALGRPVGYVLVVAAMMASALNVMSAASLLIMSPCHYFHNLHDFSLSTSAMEDIAIAPAHPLRPLLRPSTGMNPVDSSSSTSSALIHAVRGETIIVGMANRAYVDVSVMWYQRMTALGYDNHLILAADRSTAWVCQQLGMRYDLLENVTTPIIPACDTDTNKNMATDEWRKKMLMFASRWMYVRQKLIEGYHVLLSDVDSVYNDRVDMKGLFEDRPYDHYASYADMMPINVFQQTGFTICGCFNWMRSTPSMIHFLDLLLGNCGCTHEKNNNGICKCGCDDQVTMNSMMYYQMDMIWDEYKGSMDSTSKFLQNAMTGVSRKTGQRIRVVDRSFVYRGHKGNTCPAGNFVTFPRANNTEPKLEQMKVLEKNCPMKRTTFS